MFHWLFTKARIIYALSYLQNDLSGRHKICFRIGLKDKQGVFDTGTPKCTLERSTSVQRISFTQKSHSFSAPEIPQFHTKNPSVQHTPQFHTKNLSSPRSSTPKTPRFKTTKNPEVCGTERFLVLNWRVSCGTEECVELRGFGVELRDFWRGT